MRYITTQEFLKLDDANKARTLKEIAKGEVRLKEGDLKNGKSKCNRNKSKRGIRK